MHLPARSTGFSSLCPKPEAQSSFCFFFLLSILPGRQLSCSVLDTSVVPLQSDPSDGTMSTFKQPHCSFVSSVQYAVPDHAPLLFSLEKRPCDDEAWTWQISAWNSSPVIRMWNVLCVFDSSKGIHQQCACIHSPSTC